MFKCPLLGLCVVIKKTERKGTIHTLIIGSALQMNLFVLKCMSLMFC